MPARLLAVRCSKRHSICSALVHDDGHWAFSSRKTFARMHVGYVNINADRAKCSLVAARQI
jgi:hypothetical protein